MTEPPGARLRVALSGLTVAEHFRDAEKKDVLLFIDNVFRFTQAGSEVSALLGRMPSAVGYQPTLLTEMGELQERITSTKNGSITSSRRSTCRPTTTPTRRRRRPSPISTRRPTCRAIVELGIYPAVDPLASTSRILDPRIIGDEHYNVARAVKQVLQRYRDLQDIIAILGIDELSEEDKLTVSRAQRSRGSCRSRSSSRNSSPASRASYVPIAETVKSFKEIVDGSTTRCRSRRSTWWARSTKRSPKRKRWPRGKQQHGVTDIHRTADRHARQDARQGAGRRGGDPGHRRLLRRAARPHADARVAGGRRDVVPQGAGEDVPVARLRLRRGPAGSGHDPGAARGARGRHRHRARGRGEAARRGPAGPGEGHRLRARAAF